MGDGCGRTSEVHSIDVDLPASIEITCIRPFFRVRANNIVQLPPRAVGSHQGLTSQVIHDELTENMKCPRAVSFVVRRRTRRESALSTGRDARAVQTLIKSRFCLRLSLGPQEARKHIYGIRQRKENETCRHFAPMLMAILLDLDLTLTGHTPSDLGIF